MPRKMYEEVTAKQTMNRVREERMPFDWSVNPYRGCAHGCSFCYARAFQGFIGLSADDEFQNRIRIKTNAAEALERQLVREARKCGGDLDLLAGRIGLVALGTATDPYQPVEAKAGITRQCLKVLARYGIPVTITTRSPLILRDADILADMRVTSVNISINTLDPQVTRKLEPASPFPMRRLQTVEALSSRGITSGIFLGPIIPCLTDSMQSLEALVSAAKDLGAEFAAAAMLRLSPDVKEWFLGTLQVHFPHLVSAFRSLYPAAYANPAYANRLMEKVDRLLDQYGLARKLPQPAPAGDCRCPAASLPDPRLLSLPEIHAGVEQICFTF